MKIDRQKNLQKTKTIEHFLSDSKKEKIASFCKSLRMDTYIEITDIYH